MTASLMPVYIFLSVTKIITRYECTIIMMCGAGRCGCGCRCGCGWNWCWSLVSVLIVLFQVHIAGKMSVTYVTHSQSVDGRAEPAILAVFGKARWFEL